MKKSASPRTHRRALLTSIEPTRLASVAGAGAIADAAKALSWKRAQIRTMHGEPHLCWAQPHDLLYSDGTVAVAEGSWGCQALSELKPN